jgi:uncharacterized protein
MQITTYSSAAAFLAKVQAFLERREAINNLALGISMRAAEAPAPPAQPIYFATVEDRTGIILTAVMTLPHALVLSSERADVGPALDLLGRDLRAGGWRVPGVLGAPPLAGAFAQNWSAATGEPYHVLMDQGIYMLMQVRHPAYPPGEFVLATEQYVELIAGWMMAFDAEALTPGAWDEALATAHRKVRDQDIYLWVAHGQPVAMAGRARPTAHGICVNAVYTPPELRRKGYASACVAALSQCLLDQGWHFCILYTDLSNPTSNSIYQKIGYHPIGDSIMYQFGAASAQ